MAGSDIAFPGAKPGRDGRLVFVTFRTATQNHGEYLFGRITRLALGGEVAGTSAWRVNDVVAYESMREAATRLAALLLAPARHSVETSERSGAELAQLRHDVLTVDGYDRAAVAAIARRIDARIGELAGVSS